VNPLADAQGAAGEFRNQLRAARRVVPEMVTMDSLLEPAPSANAWAEKAGVYLICSGDQVRYVGRALKGQGLRRRLREHFRAPAGHSRTSSILHGEDAHVIVLALEDEDAWLAPSLELSVMATFRNRYPLINRKRS
jgi:hypothetical protein